MKMWKLGCISVALFSGLLANAQIPTPDQAVALEQQGKLAEAEKNWRQITQADPRDAAAFASLGLVLSKQGKYGQAVPAYRKAIALNPKLSGVHLNWGLAEFKQQHFDAAIAPLSAALAADPKNLQVLTLLGLSCYGANRFADAVKYLELPAESSIDPANAQALAYLGDVELKRNAPEKALLLLNKAIHLRNDIRIAYLDIGAILSEQKRYQEALAALLRAEQLDPAQPDAHYRLARIYRAIGNVLAAQREFARVGELNEKAEDMAPNFFCNNTATTE